MAAADMVEGDELYVDEAEAAEAKAKADAEAAKPAASKGR